MNNVIVEEDFLSDTIKVRVNGTILKDEKGEERTFKDSFSAAVAGAKEIDRLRDRGKTFITEGSPSPQPGEPK